MRGEHYHYVHPEARAAELHDGEFMDVAYTSGDLFNHDDLADLRDIATFVKRSVAER